jgi:peptidoglycan hydrolase-like protein with peptidoglycan-binding domain
LNSELGLKIPATGIFGSRTEKALKDFQTLHKDLILTPWVKAGRMDKEVATGYFFKRTQYVVNKMVCPNTVVEEPKL